jgi:hypothetical protein
MNEFQFNISDRVVVEVTGTVKVRQETEYGLKYIVQPDNPRAAAVHTSPEYVVRRGRRRRADRGQCRGLIRLMEPTRSPVSAGLFHFRGSAAFHFAVATWWRF